MFGSFFVAVDADQQARADQQADRLPLGDAGPQRQIEALTKTIESIAVPVPSVAQPRERRRSTHRLNDEAEGINPT